MPRLGVNIDHVATVRQARRVSYPSPLDAARAAEAGGADSITVHLREDRRHIQDRDVDELRAALRLPMNLELAATAAMVANALRVRPAEVCIVPEKREEVTTEGGLDVVAQRRSMADAVARLRAGGIRVSLFVDPDEAQIATSAAIGADAIEIHTGRYADAADAAAVGAELASIRSAATRAAALGLEVNAGHGLRYDNVAAIAAIPELHVLNIGHSIVARAVLVGMEGAVREMCALVHRP